MNIIRRFIFSFKKHKQSDTLSAEDVISTDRMPICFDIPIIDYTATTVYCKGYFRKPTYEETIKCSKTPFAIFQHAEPHGWNMNIYSMTEVVDLIKKSRPIL